MFGPVEILAGILTGAEYSINVGAFVPPDFSRGLGYGHIIMAINIENFINIEEFNDRLNHLVKNNQIYKIGFKGTNYLSLLFKWGINFYGRIEGNMEKVKQCVMETTANCTAALKIR